MQKPNENPKIRSTDPVWHLLAEYSLGEFISSHDKHDRVRSGWLFQTVQELCIPPAYVANIEITLKGFTKDTAVYSLQGKEESPGLIRIFCQENVIANPGSGKTSLPYPAEPGMERPPTIPWSSTKMNGGWGYFLIERRRNPSTDSSVSSISSIELYLYREGE